MLALILIIKQTIVIAILIMVGIKKNKPQKRAAISIGNIKYPIKLNPYKYEIFVFNNFPFRTSIKVPKNKNKITVEKTCSEDSPFSRLKNTAKNK